MLRIAVVGVGRMGGTHATNLAKRRVKNARLVAVCDLDESKLARFSCAKYTDYKALLAEKPDGVIIATEHYFHVDIALFFIEHGVNVLIEKPISVTTLMAERLDKAIAAHPELAIAVMYNQRTNAMYARARDLVKSGVMGKIQRVNYIVTGWYRSQAYYNQGGWRASLWGEGGGTLINQCVHQLDILQWIVGMPLSVTAKARTVNRDITTENEVTALFDYGDFSCSFTCSAHELHGLNRLEIACEKGRIVIGDRSMKVLYFDRSEPQVNAETKKGYGATGMKVKRHCYGKKLLPDLLFGQQLNIVKNWCNAMDGGETLISPATDGKYALTLINAAYASSWTGERIALPLDAVAYDRLLAEKKEEEARKLNKN